MRTVATLDLITGNKGDGTEQKRSMHESDEKGADLGSFSGQGPTTK